MRGGQFWRELQASRKRIDPPPPGWYPYESLSALPVIAELMADRFGEILTAIQGAPIADIGCGDGDLAMLLSRWGADVDAIDYAPNNFNGMRGIGALSSLLNLPVQVHDIDLDGRVELPRSGYGLTFFLGTLYHLKNPYSVLENLAFRTRWCILSTRVAQVTPKGGVRLEGAPLAYLADGREIENDATNYWIFSSFGLLRILQRTRWAVCGLMSIGCRVGSNPVDPNADERVFVLLKSRVHYPQLQVRPVDGWHTVEEGSWRWTEKAFSLEVVLPLEQPVSEFILSATIPEAVLRATGSLVVSCSIGDVLVGRTVYDTPGPIEFRCGLPPFALHEPVLRLDFAVHSAYSAPHGDARELGICVPLLGGSHTDTARIPCRVL